MRCAHSQKKKPVFPEEGRKEEGWNSESPPTPPPNLRKEAVISLLVCFALSVKEFQKSQVVDHDFHHPPHPPTVAACQRKGGRVALNNTLAFMEMYQMFQE